MAFTALEQRHVQEVLEDFLPRRRPPAEIRNEVDLVADIDGQAMELLEVRPAWRGPPGETTRLGIAKIRYVRRHDHWRLYWMRRDLRWHAYAPHPITATLREALEIVDEDAYACFFG